MNSRALLKAVIVRTPPKPPQARVALETLPVVEAPPVVLETPVEAQVETPVETPVETQVDPPVEAQVETQVEAQVEAQVETQVDPPVETPVETPVEAEVVTEIAPPVQEAPQATPESLLAMALSSVLVELSTGSWDSLLDEIFAYEAANKNRKKVLAAVEAQKTASQA